MAVIVYADDPNQFTETLQRIFDDGDVKAWIRDDDGDYTHSPSQWIQMAWFRIRPPEMDRVVFSLLGAKGMKMSTEVYAVYHGRFIEMLLTHLDHEFSDVEATAQRHPRDRFS